MGAHNFIIHPLLVWVAWGKLYGYTLSPYRIVQFIVHDWGYWGCTDIDGETGKDHPYLGARIVSFLFDWGSNRNRYEVKGKSFRLGPKGVDTLFHSRYMSRKHSELWGIEYGPSGDKHLKFVYQWRNYGASSRRDCSHFCAADKLAFCLENESFYSIRASLSGEREEYCAGFSDFRQCYNNFWWGNHESIVDHCVEIGDIEIRERALTNLFDIGDKRG